jgi:gamma-glutamylcyclotransferase (GGCT)/AIG2-like uncharacterized protein YtfP
MTPIAWLGSGEERVRYLPFFVYGTLKPGGAYYATYLGGRTCSEEPALLRHAVLVTDDMYPYLVVDDAFAGIDDQVHGMLMTVEPQHYLETLRRIDWLEDFKPLSALSLYLRISRVVETSAGSVEAWMYVAGPRVVASLRSGRLRRLSDGVWPV